MGLPVVEIFQDPPATSSFQHRDCWVVEITCLPGRREAGQPLLAHAQLRCVTQYSVIADARLLMMAIGGRGERGDASSPAVPVFDTWTECPFYMKGAVNRGITWVDRHYPALRRTSGGYHADIPGGIDDQEARHRDDRRAFSNSDDEFDAPPGGVEWLHQCHMSEAASELYRGVSGEGTDGMDGEWEGADRMDGAEDGADG